jgi:hypothetical protein
MARNENMKVNINYERIRKAMDAQKITFRKLSKLIGIEGFSDRILRYYIEKGACSPYMAMKIADALHMHTSQVIVAPYVIADMRLCIQVTYDEYDRLASGEEASRELIEDFLQRAVLQTRNEAWVIWTC